MSAQKISQVQLIVSEEIAAVLYNLVHELNWSDFPAAEDLANELGDLDLPIVGNEVSYNPSSGEFDRA